ncbi:MAG: acyltransferase family protein [Fibrobacter sp.]|uniref:acyltransferase family protein n=1 Tax=Fibrobacter sp. TaxID=35828 RepID=UPI001B27434B|nr:acyltransferase family protein [Fibrobacter sp.]MBO7061532.1 acyltransferase family protein [Fibrobacter sp.]
MICSDLKKGLHSWLDKLNQPFLLNQGETEILTLRQDGDRDEVFDVLKGIAIFLVIIGHCTSGPLKVFAHTFHIPLFFFIAGYFLKIRPIRQEIQLSTKRLIIPYFFVAFFSSLIAILQDLSHYTWADGTYSQEIIIRLLLGFRTDFAPSWMNGNIGILWFILAMFWARCIAVFLIGKIHSIKKLCVIFFILAILGIVLGKFVFVPYCIPHGLTASALVYVGFLIRKFRILNSEYINKILPFLLILWLCSLNHGGLGMASGNYPLGFIFSSLGALGAFLTLYIVVKTIYRKDSTFWRFIYFGGRFSLIIYCVHAIEFDNFNWKAFALLHHVPLNHFDLFQLAAHFTITLVFTSIILKIKPIKEHIFQIRNV